MADDALVIAEAEQVGGRRELQDERSQRHQVAVADRALDVAPRSAA